MSKLDMARLQHPPMRAKTRYRLGQVSLWYPMAKTKTENGLCLSGSEQPLACIRSVAGNKPGWGAKGTVLLSCDFH